MVDTEREVLVAGIGEMVITTNPNAALIAYGLGSCVALSMWDPMACVAGLAHFMLPSGPLADLPVGGGWSGGGYQEQRLGRPICPPRVRAGRTAPGQRPR